MLDIGKKIRALRLENDLTQDELASRLELTKGYISQLENNLTSPSINTLYSILEVLGTDIHEFFGGEKVEEVVVYRKDDYYEKEDLDLRNKITWLISNSQKYQMEPIILTIDPNGQSFIDNPHQGEEFGYVLEGQVTLILNKKRHIIKKGESFYYQANKEHYIINNGAREAKILWVSTPPMF